MRAASGVAMARLQQSAASHSHCSGLQGGWRHARCLRRSRNGFLGTAAAQAASRKLGGRRGLCLRRGHAGLGFRV